MKAVIPPPQSSSWRNSVDGWIRGRKIKKAFMIHITLPSVNIVATEYDISQIGNWVHIRSKPRYIS